MTVRDRLLELLADGRFHSGQALGEALGVSRAAVWKHLRALQALGLDVHAVRGRGSRCAQPLELLDAERVCAALSPRGRARLSGLDIHTDIDSTNTQLQRKAAAGAPAGSVCLAEYQRAGRGRRGRAWVSPFASNIYLSLLWRFACSPAALSGLSLAAGIGALRALRELGLEDAGLKWPNDILCGGRKVAGVLLDMTGESGGPSHVVVGVGVNVRMPAGAARSIDQPWSDLERLAGTAISRNELAGRLIEQMLDVMAVFEHDGFEAFMDEWRRYDLVAGQEVQLLLPDSVVSGQAHGIDPSGALLVRTGGEARRFASGEVSLRMRP
ncbi:MAG: bifunctional biotin--[acetyl-CoA-carboxylase] ligase/biotin operon repressor BirA [Gammaproteobacteria bacterium]